MTRSRVFINNEIRAIKMQQDSYSNQLRTFAKRGYYFLFAILSLLFFNHMTSDSWPLWMSFLLLTYQFVEVYTLLLRVDGVNIALCSALTEVDFLQRQLDLISETHPLSVH